MKQSFKAPIYNFDSIRVQVVKISVHESPQRTLAKSLHVECMQVMCTFSQSAVHVEAWVPRGIPDVVCFLLHVNP